MRNLPAQTTEYGPGGSQSALEQLLARIASGDREALGQLYHRTRSAVYALTLSYTKNAQDAEDLMQDTFVRVSFGKRYFLVREAYSAARSASTRSHFSHATPSSSRPM